MTETIYTVITFAPVQGFIEKSRKLRDLYGSSYLLSYLSWVICNAAESQDFRVVSPAQPNITQGMPNQIIIEGAFEQEAAQYAFDKAWTCVTDTCRKWIEEQVKDGWEYYWERNWGLWTKYAWEFFWVKGRAGETISDVRQRMNDEKRSRGWTGINWTGESSTLSGADAIAWPELGRICDPRKYDYQREKRAVKKFYEQLSQKLGETFIDSTTGLHVPDDKKLERSKEYGESFVNPDEELSIPELIKRLITHKALAEKLIERLKHSFEADWANIEAIAKQFKQLSEDLNPQSFTDLSRLKQKNRTQSQPAQEKYWTCWFQGDGDKAGDYLKGFAGAPDEAIETEKFSSMMRNWGDYFKKHPPVFCRVIYAGGDDFLGVFYDTKKEGRKLESKYCVDWFSQFKNQVWDNNNGQLEKKPITVSIGFVWADPSIPQRDVLQHCRDAEKSAKSKGRDRIAFRILFSNGNHLEWVCPWWLLEKGLLSSYRDRNGSNNWGHIYEDVAILEARHAFKGNTSVALALFEVYFGICFRAILEDENYQWNVLDAEGKQVKTGILGKWESCRDSNQALNEWIINLAKVGFHLCQQ